MITDDEIFAFTRLVDEARSQRSISGALDVDAPQSAALQGDAHSRDRTIFDQIHARICLSDDRPKFDLWGLRSALTKRAVLDPSLETYRNVVAAILHGTSTDRQFRDLSERQAWIDSVSLADQLTRSSLSPTLGLEREVAVATAVERLRKDGYTIRPSGMGFAFADGELDKACKDLDQLVSKLGGQRLLQCLFMWLRHKASMEAGRYLVARPSRSPTGSDSTPSVPYGYLINMAVRHLNVDAQATNLAEAARAIVDLATDIVASQDIESYYPYAHFFQSHESLPKYVQDIVVGDHALTFRQISPADILPVLRGAFSWVDEDSMRQQLGWGIKEALQLTEWTLLTVGADSVNAVFASARLEDSGLSRSVLSSMSPWFAHRASEVNREYLTPLDAAKADAQFKPFFLLPDGSFMMIAPSIASIGFYEAIAAAVRKALPKEPDTKIGQAMEGMLAQAFRTHEIQPSAVSKKYAVDSLIRDCDLVLESDQAIVLIELKKKVMTRASYSGNALAAFLDLFDGALHAQEQLGYQELQLRECGQISFIDGTCVEQKGRRIERIAVSMLDWGGTQDRVFLRQLARILIGSSLSAPAPSSLQVDALKRAHVTLKNLADQRERLHRLGDDPRNEFHNWWFLSVPQLLFVLNTVSSANGFYSSLSSVRSTTTGVLDFYREWSRMQAWKRRAESESVAKQDAV